MRTLIVGYGEIGRALHVVLQPHYPIDTIDKTGFSTSLAFATSQNLPLIMHICFPHSPDFEAEVRKYQEEHKPAYTVIHSTVPPGTSRNLKAIHSPVIGVHPNLVQSLTTFTKYLAGEYAGDVANYFRRAGMKVYLFNAPETTEIMKIMDTTFYGICVEFTKEVKKTADKFGIPFEAWTMWTRSYNDGYAALGYEEYARPNLVPIMKKIGGHCVLPNASFLENKFTKLLRDSNI